MLNMPILKFEKSCSYLNEQLEIQINNKQLLLDIIDNLELISQDTSELNIDLFAEVISTAQAFLQNISDNIATIEQLNLEIKNITTELTNILENSQKNSKTRDFYIDAFSSIKENLVGYSTKFQQIEQKLLSDNNNFNEFINKNNFKYNFVSTDDSSENYTYAGFSISDDTQIDSINDTKELSEEEINQNNKIDALTNEFKELLTNLANSNYSNTDAAAAVTSLFKEILPPDTQFEGLLEQSNIENDSSENDELNEISNKEEINEEIDDIPYSTFMDEEENDRTYVDKYIIKNLEKAIISYENSDDYVSKDLYDNEIFVEDTSDIEDDIMFGTLSIENANSNVVSSDTIAINLNIKKINDNDSEISTNNTNLNNINNTLSGNNIIDNTQKTNNTPTKNDNNIIQTIPTSTELINDAIQTNSVSTDVINSTQITSTTNNINNLIKNSSSVENTNSGISSAQNDYNNTITIMEENIFNEYDLFKPISTSPIVKDHLTSQDIDSEITLNSFNKTNQESNSYVSDVKLENDNTILNNSLEDVSVEDISIFEEETTTDNEINFTLVDNNEDLEKSIFEELNNKVIKKHVTNNNELLDAETDTDLELLKDLDVLDLIDDINEITTDEQPDFLKNKNLNKDDFKQKLKKITEAAEDNNTLLISEKSKKIYLPYKISELISYIESYPGSYNSLKDVVNQEFILPFDYFKKHPSKARFSEAYNLLKNRDGNGFIKSVSYAFKLLRKSNLNPAIIASCKSQHELDSYIYYLDANNLKNFKFFDIIYEVNPM